MMMKIHTTQNLNSMGRKQQSTNNVTIPNDEIRLNYSEQMRLHNLPAQQDSYESSISFKGKKEIVQKVVNKATEKELKGKKIFLSRFFDKILDAMEYETCVQAGVAAIVCMGLRPMVIMLTPSKKNKKDNAYASVHSMSSGVISIFTAVVLTAPFAKGLKYAKEHKLQYIKKDILKRMYPNLDINSIGPDNARKARSEWRDIDGIHKFHSDFKNPRRIATPKHIANVSEETLKSIGIDIDLNAMKGKSVNEWVDKKGNKIKPELRDMFIAVKEDGFGTNFFSLQHIDKDFLAEVYPNLDINTISKDGKRLYYDQWKNKDGSKFVLDLDNIHISSYRETASSIPLITGRKRFDVKDKTEKYCSYQTNDEVENPLRVPEKLGTEIKQEYLNADAANDIKAKLFGWMPDIVTRPFMASATIALIPWIMTHIFHMKKTPKVENKDAVNSSASQTQETTASEKVAAERKEVA